MAMSFLGLNAAAEEEGGSSDVALEALRGTMAFMIASLVPFPVVEGIPERAVTGTET